MCKGEGRGAGEEEEVEPCREGSRELIKKKDINKNKFSGFLTCNLLLGTRNRRTDIAFCNQILSVQVEYSPESQS